MNTSASKTSVYDVLSLSLSPSLSLSCCMCTLPQALAGEVGMSAELDEVAKSLYNGQIPHIWRVLAPATLKSLGNWMIHFLKRNEQYVKWVSECCIVVLSTGGTA